MTNISWKKIISILKIHFFQFCRVFFFFWQLTRFNLLVYDFKMHYYACDVFGKDRRSFWVASLCKLQPCFKTETLNTARPHRPILTRPLGKDDGRHRKTSGSSKHRLTQNKTKKKHLPVVPHKECQVCPQFPNVGNISTNICPADCDWKGGGGAVSSGSLIRHLIWDLCHWARPDHSRHLVDTVNQRVESKTPAEGEKKQEHRGEDPPTPPITSCVSTPTRHAQSRNTETADKKS